MRKKLLISGLAVVIIMILSVLTTGKNTISADVKKDAKKDDTTECDFTGTWYLTDNTDFYALGEVFPDFYAFGDEMVIRPDGKLYWHIGAAGAAGNYEVKGNQLIAVVADIMEYDECKIVITMDDDGSLYMKYKSVPLKWNYGGTNCY